MTVSDSIESTLCRFFGAQTLNVPQYEHCAKWRGQRIDRALQQDTNFPERGLTLWICIWCSPRKLDDLAHGFVVQVSQRQRLSPPAQPALCLVDHDARQPGAECGLLAESSESTERSHVGVLHNFLGFPIGPDDASRGAKQAPVVAAHDLAKCRSASATSEPNQLAFTCLLERGCRLPTQRPHTIASRFRALDVRIGEKVPVLAVLQCTITRERLVPATHPIGGQD